MKVLTFFAHPDDETVMCGGTLALLARHGAEVHFLCATRGEGGENGDPPLCTKEELGNLRSQEVACAVKALGGTSLSFLGYIDPAVGENGELSTYTDDFPGLVKLLQDKIRHIRPDVVITHGSNGEYGHPAHLLSHRAAYQAVSLLDQEAPLLYTVQASYPNHPKPRLQNKEDPAHFIIDISSVLSQKIKAYLCHRTQHPLFIRRASEEAGRQVTITEVVLKLKEESFHRAYPPFDTSGKEHLAVPIPSDALTNFLLSTGVLLYHINQ